MKRFKRSHIENFVVGASRIDWKVATQECWEYTFRRVQAMKKSLDVERESVKGKLRLVHGSLRN